MLANSKGQTLTDHLKAVACTAQEIARLCGYSEKIQKLAYAAGLLHDIGKATKSFQHCLASGQSYDEAISPTHHEISWAFLIQSYGISEDNELIFNAIYWHHARPLDENYESLKYRDEIISKIDDSDRRRITDFIHSLSLPDLPNLGSVRHDECVPDLFFQDGTYDKNTNAEMLGVRMCLISADRMVSRLSAENVAAIAHGEVPPSKCLSKTDRPFFETYSCPLNYQAERFDIQQGCARQALKNRTVIAKAPAGFGKTMIGVLYALFHGKQSYWVCPRNVVAEAVYRNIIREIRALNLFCSVELFLSGERKNSNTPEGLIPDFSSDIVVTNIDNLLGPMVNNRTADRLFNVLSGVVILDEFHEFVSDSPLFAAFITYMRARHRLSTTACTLLLSATPTNVHKLWDWSDHETTLLPDQNQHYPAAHEGNYRIKLINEFPKKVLPASLCIFNSVSMAQDQFLEHEMEYLIHSKFTDSDRQQILERIYTSFGKDGSGIEKGERISSALIMQAAMDVSSANLYDSVCSPETTLQRIGRCDRWGTYSGRQPEVFLFTPSLGKDKYPNECHAIETIYNRELNNLWTSYLLMKISDGRSITLKDWYEIYNSFYKEHGKEVWAFLRDQYKNGLENLINYYPVKLIEAPSENTHHGKSLRSPSGSYYFTVKIKGTRNRWLSPDDVMNEGYDELCRRFYMNGHHNAELINASKMMPRINALYENGYIKFKRIIKQKKPPTSLPKWFRLARNPETPIPDFSRVYDNKLGLIQIFQKGGAHD